MMYLLQRIKRGRRPEETEGVGYERRRPKARGDGSLPQTSLGGARALSKRALVSYRNRLKLLEGNNELVLEKLKYIYIYLGRAR